MGEPGPCSSGSEYRLALFNKGAARFAVIFRLTTMDVVGSLRCLFEGVVAKRHKENQLRGLSVPA